MNYNQLFIGNYGDRELCLEKGQGVYVQDTQGKRYLDFGSGIAVNSLGYSHPVLVDAIKRQADKIWHTSNLYLNQPSSELAHELTSRTFADKVFFCNSGLEANEAALKLARKRGNDINPQKNSIVCFTGAFHGRSLFTLSLGGKEAHRQPYAPLPDNITRVAFNDCDALQKAMNDDVCAIIIEPIQGEGGVNPASPELIKLARSLSQKHNALLIFDEIQCGMGRAGSLFNYMGYDGVTPDLMTCAKGLGGGFPIGCLLATAEAAESFSAGNHGSTFGGSALGCTVACEVIRIVDDAKFLNNVQQLGKLLQEQLQLINKEFNCFSEIRGKGLLWGGQLSDKYEGAKLLAECRSQGLLLLLAGNADVLRFAPPLIISESQLMDGLELLRDALQNHSA